MVYSISQLIARLKAKTRGRTNNAPDEHQIKADELVALGEVLETLSIYPPGYVEGFPGGTQQQLFQFMRALIGAGTVTPAAPTITGFLPMTGAQGDTVVLTGTNFTGATVVSINNGAVASFDVESATQITAVLSDSQATGKVRVTVPGAGTAVSAADFTVTAPIGNNATLLVMAGQSNCMGVGAISSVAGSPMAALTPDPLREFQRVMIWSPTSSAFVKLQAGVNNLAVAASFGAEIGLAQRWEDENTTGILYIVKDPRDGRPIADWDKTNANGAGGYAELVGRVNAAKANLVASGKTVLTKGFIWSQGESDPGDTAYASKLQTLVNNLTLDTIVDTGTKLVISKVRSDATVGAQDAVFVSNNASKAVLIDTANYAMNGDNLHYNYRAQFLSGYTDFYNPIFGLQSAYPFPMVGSAVGGTTPPAGGTTTTASIEETDTRLYYAPTFADGVSGQDSGGANRTLTNTDGFCGVTFTGTAFALDFADFGNVRFEVWIDDMLQGFVVSNGSQALAERFGISGLANTQHHAQLVARGSDFKRIWVDRIRCAGAFAAYSGSTTLPAAPTVIGAGDTEETNAAWHYFDAGGAPATFDPASGVPSNLGAVFTTNAGWYATIQFQGTGFSLTSFSLGGGYAANYDVFVDGVLAGHSSPPADGSNFGICFTSPVFPAGIHTLKLVCTGCLAVDKITVTA